MPKVTEITQGVKVSVETYYQPDYSSPLQQDFVFTYKVRIENCSDYTIQLLSRKWHIYDSDGTYKEVEGEGVVGQQPILEPGQDHEYMSGCKLHTTMGKMTGFYTFERFVDGSRFDVKVPDFNFVTPYKLN